MVSCGKPAERDGQFTREIMTMTVGEFLLWRIRQVGIGHAFGVPGD